MRICNGLAIGEFGSKKFINILRHYILLPKSYGVKSHLKRLKICLEKRVKIQPLLFKNGGFSLFLEWDLLFWNEIHSKGMKSQSLFCYNTRVDGISLQKKNWDFTPSLRSESYFKRANLTLKRIKICHSWTRVVVFSLFFQDKLNFQSLRVRFHSMIFREWYNKFIFDKTILKFHRKNEMRWDYQNL